MIRSQRAMERVCRNSTTAHAVCRLGTQLRGVTASKLTGLGLAGISGWPGQPVLTANDPPSGPNAKAGPTTGNNRYTSGPIAPTTTKASTTLCLAHPPRSCTRATSTAATGSIA